MNYGINLTEAKRSLVFNRLNKRSQNIGANSLDEYFKFVFSEKGVNERSHLCDYLSTNKTYFYRESSHFAFFNQFLSKYNSNNQLSIWSAACSSGDELYTISMLLHEHMVKYSIRLAYGLLGTDISAPMLQQAKSGIYNESHLAELPKDLFNRYFTITSDKKYPYKLVDKVKHYTLFTKFNLIKDMVSMNKSFDFIFCRNVLIYFKKEVKDKVVSDLITKLKPGGYLVLGHCEGMIGRTMDLKQIQPGIFQKATQ